MAKYIESKFGMGNLANSKDLKMMSVETLLTVDLVIGFPFDIYN